MDPNTLLIRILDDLGACDPDLDDIENLVRWCAHGGFAPTEIYQEDSETPVWYSFVPAVYSWAADCHTGQGSQLYRILSLTRMFFSPGASPLAHDDLAQVYYADLMASSKGLSQWDEAICKECGQTGASRGLDDLCVACNEEIEDDERDAAYDRGEPWAPV